MTDKFKSEDYVVQNIYCKSTSRRENKHGVMKDLQLIREWNGLTMIMIILGLKDVIYEDELRE